MKCPHCKTRCNENKEKQTHTYTCRCGFASKHSLIECGECGSQNSLIIDENHTISYYCLDCKFKSKDYYEDLYGCMSVPWGFSFIV
jgi:hypothetical protein